MTLHDRRRMSLLMAYTMTSIAIIEVHSYLISDSIATCIFQCGNIFIVAYKRL